MTQERRIIGSQGDPGDAAPSVVARALTPTFAFPGMAPPAPTNLVLTPSFSGDDIFVDANWTPAPPSAAGAITSYAIEVLTDGQILPHVEHPPADGLPPYRIHNLSPNQLYHITIRAITGLGATSSSLTGDVTTGHSTAAPPKVTGLAGGVGFKTATLTWDQLGTTLAPFNGKYYVEVATDVGMTSPFHAPYDNGPSSIITVANLVTLTPYYFRVHAVSASGISGPASDVFGPLTPGLAQGQFQPSDGIAPSYTTSAPTMQGGPGYLFIEWVTITNDDIVTYEVHLGTTSPFTVTSGSKVGEVVGGTTFFAKLDGGGGALAYDQNYYARIYPKDKDGYTTAGPSPTSTAAELVRVGASDVATINSNQLKDGNPPSSSPTTHIVGGVGFLHVWWSPVTNNDLVTYDVHLSTTTGFIPDAGTLVTSTTTTGAFLRTLPGSSTALSYDTTYFVRIVARDVDGSAGAGVQGSAQVLRVDAPDIVANSISSASGVFGVVDASVITTGTLAAARIGAGSVDATKLSVTIGGQNFGLNTGFERASDGQIPDSWTLGSGTVSTSQGFFVDTTTRKYGTRSWRITATTAAEYYGYQEIVLAPGRWTVSCWIKRASVVAVSGQGSGLNLDGTVITPVRNWLGTVNTDIITTGTNEFRQEWSIIDVGGTGDTLRVYMQQGYSGTCTGTTWFDGLSVTQGDLVVAWSPPADEILPGTIVANMMTANSITAENAALADATITNAKIVDLSASKITTGTLNATNVAVTGLSASVLTAGTLGADIGYIGDLAADQIKTGTLNATGTITVRHLDATEITTGTMSFDRLQGGTLGAYTIILTNGGVIRSENFSDVAGAPAGWQIDGAGNLTANFANLRNGLYTAGRIQGTEIIGGSFLISNKFYVADSSSRIECIANIDIGFNYSGGVFATNASYDEDVNWGMSIDHPSSDVYSTKLRYFGGGQPEERRAGVYDQGTGWAFFADQNTTCQARTSWGIFSSEEIKRDIVSISGNAVEMLSEMRPVTFRLNTDPDDVSRMGFIAEEVLHTSMSSLVTDLGADSESRYSLAYMDLIPVLTRAVGELHQTDDTQTTRMNVLESRIAALEVH